jgi:hypothetical protein
LALLAKHVFSFYCRKTEEKAEDFESVALRREKERAFVQLVVAIMNSPACQPAFAMGI